MTEIPEEWKFLTEGPQPWVAPSELHATSKSSTINLIVQIVLSDIAGNDAIEAAGRMLSSYASLNIWIAADGRDSLDFEGITKVSVEMTHVTRDVYLAWVAFREVFEPTRRAGLGEAERLALVRALRNGSGKLDQLRNGGTGDNVNCSS